MSAINYGYPVQGATNIASACATVLITVGSGEVLHLQRLAVSVASITDGSFITFGWSDGTTATVGNFHSVSASVTNVGFLDWGDRGYVASAGACLTVNNNTNCKYQVSAVGYKIG